MLREYVEEKNGGYRVSGTRVSLDSIVYLYRDGASPEQIQDDFPSVTLEQIHGALAFYLANKAMVDENIDAGEHEVAQSVPLLATTSPDLYERLQRARQGLKLR